MPNRSTNHSLTLTVEEAAALIGVSRSTAYDLAGGDELPTVRLRRRILVPAASLADLLGVSPVEVYAALSRLRGGSEPAEARRLAATPSAIGHTQVERNQQGHVPTEPDGAQQLW